MSFNMFVTIWSVLARDKGHEVMKSPFYFQSRSCGSVVFLLIVGCFHSWSKSGHTVVLPFICSSVSLTLLSYESVMVQLSCVKGLSWCCWWCARLTWRLFLRFVLFFVSTNRVPPFRSYEFETRIRIRFRSGLVHKIPKTKTKPLIRFRFRRTTRIGLT